ncbi:hypothetical protein H5410_001704, partial [Solanum commersonii]
FKKRILHKLTEKEKKSAELHVLLNCPEVQPFLDYFVSQYGHDQVFPSFITWYTNWVMDAELEMNLEHPDHILEEVNKEELDMPTNMEGDEEETFEEDEWIDEEETSKMMHMVDKDKGKSKKSSNPKKKFKANAMRRPIGSWISDEPSRS